jgi:predicted O-methyltransferase YrrM
LNYLFDADNDRQNLEQFFRRIYHALTEGGVFIFDQNNGIQAPSF